MELVLRKRRPEHANGVEPSISLPVDNPLMSSELPVEALITNMVQPLTPDERPQEHVQLINPIHPAEPDKVPALGSVSESAGHAQSAESIGPADLQTSVSHTSTHDIGSVAGSGKATLVQRPTYVRLPTPTSFSMDQPWPDPSPTHSIQFPSGGKQGSSLKTFDENFNHGTPSASFNSINIETNMPVLVVDDDPLTRTLMKRILTRLGCQVSLAENGEVALEMILGQRITMGATPSSDASGNFGPILEQTQDLRPFDKEGKYAVVFLDNQMPVLSGLKVASKLRELERTDFIVGVTGMCFL